LASLFRRSRSLNRFPIRCHRGIRDFSAHPLENSLSYLRNALNPLGGFSSKDRGFSLDKSRAFSFTNPSTPMTPRAIQSSQVFPPHTSNSLEFLAGAENLSRTSATIFRIPAVRDGNNYFPPKVPPKQFPRAIRQLPDRSTPHHPVMDGHGNWSAPDNNQTNN